jgi:hypothetical protein
VELTKLHHSTKDKFIWIYILNVTDILFTQLLLTTGQGYEVNILMRGLVKIPLFAIAVKVIFIGVLLIIALKYLKGATNKELKTIKVVTYLVLGLYIFLNVSHIINCAILF